MGIYKAMKWSTLVSGILLILLGIVSLFTPLQSLMWLAFLISLVVLVSGIAALINYFTTDKEVRSGWLLAEAIISTLIGVWMVFGSGSGTLTLILPYVFAIFIFAAGVIRIAEAMELKADGAQHWGWLLAFGILSIVLGVLLIFAPMISATFMAVALSLLLIGYGISNITVFVNMRRAGNYIRRRIRERSGESPDILP